MPPERKFDHEEAKRLRATGEYTVDELAAHFGVTKGAISQATKEVDASIVKRTSRAPENFAQMKDRASSMLWSYFQEATGVAKVQAYKAIVQAAKEEEAEGVTVKEPEPLLADVVSGAAALSPIRRLEILTVERARFAEELAAIDRALGEVAA